MTKKSTETDDIIVQYIDLYIYTSRAIRTIGELFGDNDLELPYDFDIILDMLGFRVDNTVKFDLSQLDPWPEDCYCRDYLYFYLYDAIYESETSALSIFKTLRRFRCQEESK